MLNSIDDYIWKVQKILMEKYGVDEGERDIDPLKWYIHTGRAPTKFIHHLLDAKPFMIARKLHMGGSVNETIDRIKIYIKYEEVSQ